MREIATSDYWNKRVIAAGGNLKDMIFIDPRREDFWERVWGQLSLWEDQDVLDVCCGFGKFSHRFQMYTGLDVSEEMIGLARENYPAKDFHLFDVLNDKYAGMADVVFEVNSLHSLGLTPQEFYDKFKDNARSVVACLECDQFTIFNKYDGR